MSERVESRRMSEPSVPSPAQDWARTRTNVDLRFGLKCCGIGEMIQDVHHGMLESLTFGKRLPGAVYLFRPRECDVPPELWATIRRAEVAAQPALSWNLLKIHTDQFAFTFLSYPEFDTDPHPVASGAAHAVAARLTPRLLQIRPPRPNQKLRAR